MGTYLNEDGSEGDTFHDACEAVAAEEEAEKRTHQVALTGAELELLTQALDSHAYWQLSDEGDRKSGMVYLHGDGETCPDGCADPTHAEIRQCEALAERLRKTAE